MKETIYVGATGQNVGKTAVCLGLFSKLKKKFSKVGFIKPVGQRHVMLEGIAVDKDVALFKSHFHLDENAADMSPVVFTQGFTKKVLDQKVTSASLEKAIIKAHKELSKTCDAILIEGTGHMGVGSVADLSCARVAKILNAKTILVAKGGIGSTLDEIAVNKALLESESVELSGVVINKVLDSKKREVLKYLKKGLKKWDLPVVGCVPYAPFLATPTMHDYAFLFKEPLLAGESKRFCHFTDRMLAVGPIGWLQKQFKKNQLIITSAAREELVCAILAYYEKKPDIGLILTGSMPPAASMLELVRKADIPTLYVNMPSYFALEKITSFVTKFQPEDSAKTLAAIKAIAGYLDVSTICQIPKKKLS